MSEIVPYGDTAGDAMVQLSFTLPVPADAGAREVGLQFLRNNGFLEPQIVHATAADRDMTFYVAYAKAARGVDPGQVTATEAEAPQLDYRQVNALIERELGRKVVVIGAAIESDAHTVGIDAIMNMKGFAGDYGLERYPWIDAVTWARRCRASGSCGRRRSGTPTRSWCPRWSPSEVTGARPPADQAGRPARGRGLRDRVSADRRAARGCRTRSPRSWATTPGSAPARRPRRSRPGSRPSCIQRKGE